VHYDDGESTEKAVVNDSFTNATVYILDNLTPFTDYKIYVTAVRYVGGNSSRLLEGERGLIIQNKTLAGGM